MIEENTIQENALSKEHYDVGVFGVWSGCNYGSIATYYALNRILTGMGKSVLMIDKPVLSDDDIELKDTHARRFANQHYNISKQYKLRQMNQLNNLCDAFLIGSDQVWNYGISKNFGKAFYLDFASAEKKKIAYGVSFGHGIDFAPGDEREVISDYMSYFDGIGTREADGVKLCRECYGIKAEQVLDPVFLADPKIYEPLIEQSSHKEEEPFIVTYILDPSPEKREAILHLQKEFGGIKVINLLDGLPWLFEKNKRLTDLPNCIENLQVEDWLYYLKNARFVLTDSCHGASFALIFKRNFIAITNKHRGFSRFTSLSQLFKFEDHLITEPREILKNPALLSPINYDVVTDIMESERKRCAKWLYDAINLPKESEEQLKERNIIGTVNPINKRLIPKPINGLCDEMTVLKVVNEENCSGCGACEGVCPKDAIHLKKNIEGFLVPNVNRNKCINCGLCLKKCTSVNPVYKNVTEPKCYAMMASDETRRISSSGGMFTVAAEYIMEQGGYVCGAAYNEDYTVEHIITNDRNELGRLRGSKYMQSYASGVYPVIKKLLQNGKLVLFTGMPCQVAGLYSYLGREYDTLYTMDLLCHGITSSKVFEKYHKDVLNGKELSRLEFKEKEPWGWHAGVNAYFTDGTKYSKPLEYDLYFVAYLKSIAKNTTCGKCVSNKLPRQGDLTIGDFWGIARHDEEVYDKKGTSVVLVNNPKAEKFFEKLKSRMKKVKEEPLAVAIKGNRIIQGPYRLHKNRERFFEYFDKLDFASLTRGCYHNELYKYSKMELSKTLPEELHEYYYIAKTVAEKSRGRKIVTWIQSKKFEKVLNDCFGMKVAFSVARTEGRINNETVFPFSRLKNGSGKVYVVALDSKNVADTYKLLNDYGYREVEDFISRFPKPIVLNDYDLASGIYEDAYGNTIEGYTGKIGKVVFRGCNNHIIIGDKVTGTQNLTFDLSANAYIEIERENRINAENKFITRGYTGSSEVIIRRGCRLTNVLYRLYNNRHVSAVLINEDCTFESNLELHANSGKKIIIGRDCMFSHDIDLWAGDGHSIFDVTTGENVNSVYEKLPPYRNAIVLGEHVWVSKGAFIMHGTNIGNGSIVGAKSVVKGQFPNNCTIGGNPAAIIKRNSAWSRDMETNDSDKCGKKEYYALTSDAKAPISGAKVLVIGGTRFMGVHLVKNLVALGNDVTIASRGHKKDDFGADVKRKIIDVHDAGTIKREFNGECYDVIFDNLASCSATVDNIVKNIKCKRYIQLSSIAVYRERKMEMQENMYDGMSIQPKIEDIPLNYSSKEYGKGKRLAEAYLYQCCKKSAVTVRIPYVSPTNRIYNYCENIVNGIPFKVTDMSRTFSFVQAEEVGHFLSWIAAQEYDGPINFSSEGYISIGELISYIEKKTGKNAIIDNSIEANEIFKEKSFSLNLNKVKTLGYNTTNIHEWFWDLLDKNIERALKEKK